MDIVEIHFIYSFDKFFQHYSHLLKSVNHIPFKVAQSFNKFFKSHFYIIPSALF